MNTWTIVDISILRQAWWSPLIFYFTLFKINVENTLFVVFINDIPL